MKRSLVIAFFVLLLEVAGTQARTVIAVGPPPLAPREVVPVSPGGVTSGFQDITDIAAALMSGLPGAMSSRHITIEFGYRGAGYHAVGVTFGLPDTGVSTWEGKGSCLYRIGPEPHAIVRDGAPGSIIYLADMGNTFKTAVLLTALTLFLLFMGQIFGGERGLVIAFGFAILMNFVSYFWSDKIALAMYRAQPVTREQLPRAYAAVERLTQKMGIPMPKMYVIPTDSPNAFATGRNPQHASVAVTEGILNLLNDEELEGVLAHELGHVRNRDILISSVAATLAGAITMLARMGYWASLFGGMGDRDDRDRGGGFVALLMLILAPIAATLIQLAVSRSREYQADATGAQLTGNPYALASALKKLDAYSKRIPLQASPSTAHLFIVAPLLGGMNFASLFSTHPPIAKRIERLTGRPAEFDY